MSEPETDPSDTPPDEPVTLRPPAGPGPTVRPRWLAVLGVVAVLAVAGIAAVVVAGGGGDDEVSAGAGGGGSTPATALWGHRWAVASIDEGGVDRPVARRGDEPIVLDASREGDLSYNGCNGGFGRATLEGDTLRAGPFGSTEMACTDPEGEARVGQDAWLGTFLSSRPTVSLDGAHLTLTTDAATVSLVRVGGGATGSTTLPADPDAPVSDQPLDSVPRATEDVPYLPDPGSGSSIPTTVPAQTGGPGGGKVGG